MHVSSGKVGGHKAFSYGTLAYVGEGLCPPTFPGRTLVLGNAIQVERPEEQGRALMAMLSTDQILAPSRGGVARAVAFLSHPDDTDRQLVKGLYRWGKVAGVDAAIAVAQAYLETIDLTSIRWIRDRNSASIGIPSTVSAQPFEIPDGDAAARLQIQCMFALVERRLHPDVPLWPAAEEWIGTHWLDWKAHDPGCPDVETIADLNRVYRDQIGAMAATWTHDATYHTRLIAKGNAIFGHTLDGKDLRVPTSPTRQPAVEISLTPAGNLNRPGLEMASPSFITVHDVSEETPGSDEQRLRAAVHAGGGSEHTSYHFVVGSRGIIQLLPLDEVAWHAGDGYFGAGNRDSVAIALVQSGDTGRSRANLSWLLAELITNPGRFVANQPRAWEFSERRIRRQTDWVPGESAGTADDHRAEWTEVMEQLTESLARHGDSAPRPQPIIPDFMTDVELARGIDRRMGDTTAYALRRLWCAARDTPRLQHAGPGAPELGPPIRQGESFIGEFVFKSHGSWWVLTRWGARVRMDDLEPQIELKAA